MSFTFCLFSTVIICGKGHCSLYLRILILLFYRECHSFEIGIKSARLLDVINRLLQVLLLLLVLLEGLVAQGHCHELSCDQAPGFEGGSDSETSYVLVWFHWHIFSFHWMIINNKVAPDLCQYLKRHNPRQFLGQMVHLSLSTVVGWQTRSLAQLNQTVQIQVL